MATLNIEAPPDALYRALQEHAESHHRSVEQEVTHLPTEALHREEPLSILELQGLGRELWSKVDGARHVEDERASWNPPSA